MNLFRVMTLFAASLLFGSANEVDSDSEPVQSAVPDETPSPVRADDPEASKPAAELARLRKIWHDWKLKATSMEVEGFEFYGVIHADDNQLSHNDLIKLIQEDLPKLVNQNEKYDVAALEAVTSAKFPRPTKENVNSATFGRWAEISLVRDASNLKFVQSNEIDRAEFNLGVPAGTNVVLFEGAPGDHPKGVRPAMAFTKRAVDDAAEFAHSEEFQNAQRK